MASAMPPFQRGGAQRAASPKFWDLLHARTLYEKRQPNFFYSDQTIDVKKIFARSITNADARSVFGS